MRAGADAIYPGYGFLSENPALAEACANAGITFIGPTADVLTLTGNKARAIAAAKAAGVPTLALGGARRTDVDVLVAAAEGMRYPLFVKAVAGGGGRGMRRVDDPAGPARADRDLHARGARRAFGDPTVFIEQAVVDPRHIEVQILADGDGQRDPPVRARLLGAAAAPEGRRDRARRRTSTAELRTGSAPTRSVRQGDRLPQRRHRRVPARPARATTSSSR